MAWMPGDNEAAAAVEAMQEIYGSTALAITPEVKRRDGMDRCHFTRRVGDRIRVVVLQRVGDCGTEPSARRWSVLDAFEVCVFGERDPLVAVKACRVGPLDEMAQLAERWCRLGVWG